MADPDASTDPVRHFHSSDIRGLVKLAVQATSGVTEIVESVHQSVLDTLGVPGGKATGQTGGITGLAYRAVNGVTTLLGKGADAAITGFEALSGPSTETSPASPEREAALAVLNGLMGDRLLENKNPLAISMSFQYQGEPLSLQDPSPLPTASGKVLLLIHGLCMSDLHWSKEDLVGHGETLASSQGYTPVYLRYNSGLHISQNGIELSTRLEQLLAEWPVPVEELTIVAHSMGGLMARSAAHHARTQDMQWPEHLKNMVFLGTPHHGAPLERGGNWLDLLLSATPYTRPFTALGRLRSPGITDLRYGHVLDEDHHGRDRFQRLPDSRSYLPLPESVSCYTVAATTARERSVLADHLIGDGLVPLKSALGEHRDHQHKLNFAPTEQWIAYQTNHLQLLHSDEVTRQLMKWLGQTRRKAVLS